MQSTTALRVSAIFGFLAVAIGAFGAHGLKPTLLQNGTLATFETGAHYHLIHSVVMLWVASRDPFPARVWWCFLLGVLIFSGTLYALSITGVKILGAITPIGGLFMLAGWLFITLGAARMK